MNILILCTKFSLDENDAWLTNELADAFQHQGHQTSVIVVDWGATFGRSAADFKSTSGVDVNVIPAVNVSFPVPFVSKAMKWIFSSFAAYRKLHQKLKKEKPDLVITFSPSVTMAFPILAMAVLRHKKKFLIQWDFFPYHHKQIGLLSSRFVFSIAKKAEELLIRRFDAIGCMSQRNVDYLRSHYRLRSRQKVAILPVWGRGASIPDVDRDAIRARYGLPEIRPLAVFGGQLAVGRGLEDLLAAANLSERLCSNIVFVVIGSGPLGSLLTDYLEKGHSNVVWIPRVPRIEYLQVIKACDLALVCTVRNVDVPSFPSKTIDYLRAGLPIVASVEKTTDYGDYIVSKGVGLSVEAGHPDQLYAEIERLLHDEKQMLSMKRQGPHLFMSEMEVEHVAKRLLQLVAD
ncbi:glycosyltransferase family 4 protein [Paralcaligenes sp. KSB-10]|uniref:glycosyltransferase family 4 protein n=1 Tax=Paralcaligenes sp. KSB-10 TaxID=2901142 RepID=UPI001E4DCF54|nr:glycosyltransferase family 4 protein [Paralcaligenes sp. KSB-10]UHL63241.1 glycosyltransferase family 4 protein [Paralcaligenes sp. KSB-10]